MTLKKFKEKYVILWPQYFDSTLSHKKGRKVPKELSVPKPSQRELIEVAEKLGYEVIKLEGRYPREWWVKEGPIAVSKMGKSKREILREIGAALRRRRYEESERG